MDGLFAMLVIVEAVAVEVAAVLVLAAVVAVVIVVAVKIDDFARYYLMRGVLVAEPPPAELPLVPQHIACLQSYHSP